jgi:hypothetical protein
LSFYEADILPFLLRFLFLFLQLSFFEGGYFFRTAASVKMAPVGAFAVIQQITKWHKRTGSYVETPEIILPFLGDFL